MKHCFNVQIVYFQQPSVSYPAITVCFNSQQDATLHPREEKTKSKSALFQPKPYLANLLRLQATFIDQVSLLEWRPLPQKPPRPLEQVPTLTPHVPAHFSHLQPHNQVAATSLGRAPGTLLSTRPPHQGLTAPLDRRPSRQFPSVQWLERTKTKTCLSKQPF